MGLDVSLYNKEGKCVYDSNITHNLNKMADAAGIYGCLWRPDEIGISKASQIIEPLAHGVAKLAMNKAYYETFNSPNGWGLWEHFLLFCARYLQACRDNPDSEVVVSR